VLEAVTPAEVTAAAERFDTDVIRPYQAAHRERDDAVREQYSM